MRSPKAHQRKSGAWEVKFPGIDGRRKSFYGRSAEEAVRKALRESPLELDQTTLYGFYAQVYLPSVLHLAEGTLRAIGVAMDRHWLPLFGDWPIKQIKRRDVQEALNRLAPKVSSGTLAQYKSKLAQVLELAVADELIASNPAKGARTPYITYKEVEPLTASELWNLHQSTEGSLRNAVILMGFFGLRVGEACGVTEPVNVVKQWGGKALKTPSSRRNLPVPKECTFEPHGPLLVGLSPQAVRERLRPFGVNPHRLRHTFNTLLEWDLECPRAVTTYLMGHKGGTGETYSHRKPEVLRSWLSRYWNHVSTQSVVQIVVNSDKS